MQSARPVRPSMPPIFESNTTRARATFSTVHRTSDWIWKRRPLSRRLASSSLPAGQSVAVRPSTRPRPSSSRLGRRRLALLGRGIHWPCYHFEATLTSRGINLPHNLDEMPSHTTTSALPLCLPADDGGEEGEGRQRNGGCSRANKKCFS